MGKQFLLTPLMLLVACSGNSEKQTPITSNQKNLHQISSEQKTVQEAFTSIYNTGEWGCNEAGEGCSGLGSNVMNVRPYVQFLQNFIQQHDVKSIVDVGCGDWEFSRFVDWNGAQYLGLDVVAHLIEKNQRVFANENVSFQCLNAAEATLPEADLLICKDVLQHLSIETVLSICDQLPKFKYCIITNDVDPKTLTSENIDIVNDGYRVLDLTAAPFNLDATKALLYNAHDDNMK